MILGKNFHRFKCPLCGRVVERQVHGNVKTIPSYCDRKGKDAILRRVAHRCA